jgi:Ca-activated chloride channel family protein
MFRLATPWLLLAIPVVLLAAWRMARRRATGDARIGLPRAQLLRSIRSGGWVRFERGLPWLRGLILVLLVITVARPQSGEQLENVSTLGVDIVVALDVSGSMRAEDFTPKNRLEVARRTVDRFVEGRPSDRVGLVVFAAVSTTRCPLTQDHEMLRSFLGQVEFAPPEQDGTAIGLGLATAVNRLRDSDAKSRVVVLVTDGVNNAGQVGPQAAAEAARALEVKVYTVGVGSEGRVPIPVDLGPMGRRTVMQEVELDEELLREIADTTGGQYFRATDPDGLDRVFETIDELEKTEIESEVRVLYSELFSLTLFPALVLLILERLLVSTRLRRLP